MPKAQNRTATINYKPAGPKYQTFHDAWRTSVRILCGAWGSGKSFAAAAEIVEHLLDNPAYIGKTALVVGLTGHHCENQLYEQIFLPILTGAQDKRGNPIGMIPEIDFEVWKKPQLKIRFSNGSTILFASLEQKQNLAGFSVSMVYVDELDKIEDEKIWALCQSRVRGESEYGFAIATCNSDKGQGHWLYQRYFGPQENDDVVPPGHYLETLSIYDNKFLSPDDLERSKRMCFGDARLEQAYLQGKWVSLSGIVFDTFDMRQHVYTPREGGGDHEHSVPVSSPRYVGMDFGFGDETAAIFLAKHPNDGRYYIFREYYQSGKTPRENSIAIRRLMSLDKSLPVKWVSDVAPEVRLTYRELGLPLVPAEKGKGSVMQTYTLLRQLFFEDKIRISADCPNLIRELLTKAWDPRTNEPSKKGDDHAIDSLRYIIGELEGKGSFAIFSPKTYNPAQPSNGVIPFYGSRVSVKTEDTPPCECYALGKACPGFSVFVDWDDRRIFTHKRA